MMRLILIKSEPGKPRHHCLSHVAIFHCFCITSMYFQVVWFVLATVAWILTLLPIPRNKHMVNVLSNFVVIWYQMGLDNACITTHATCSCMIILKKSNNLFWFLPFTSFLVKATLNPSIDSLDPGRCGSYSKNTIFKLIINNSSLGIHCLIALRWMPQNVTDEKSQLVQVIQVPSGRKSLPEPILTQI